MARKGKENLISLADRTTEEQRQIAALGGKASGEARRARKTLKEELLLLLETEEMQKKLCTAMIQQAELGNTKAFEIVRDTIGEKPIESIEINNITSDTIQEIEKYVESNDE